MRRQFSQVPQTSTSVVATRSKAKAKPQPRELAGTTATIPIQRRWIDIEPSEQNLASYDLSKKVINLLRHNQTSLEFFKIKFHLRNHHSQKKNWSDDRWKACLAAGRGSKRRYQYCSDSLKTILYLRALQGHSGSNLIDPRRQKVFFLPVDPRDESHRDPEYIDFSVPRLARYMHSAWKRHQDAVFWVNIDLGIREGFFYQTRSNAIILQGTLPAHCIVKVERLKSGEKCGLKHHISLLDHHQRSL